MTILEIIGKITLCLALAAALGFLIGWFFSAIRTREKANQEYAKLYEEFEVKRHKIRELEEEIDLKNETIQQMEQQYQNCERERLNAQLDEKDCEKYQRVIEELRSENDMLISQIKEQKICEDENTLLQDEIKTLEEEKEILLQQIDECKEYKENYKTLILEIESLKSEKEKLEAKQHLSASSEEEKIRIFDAYEAERIPAAALSQLKDDLMTLKSEVEKIRNERDNFKEEVERLRKKLDQKKKELKQCKTKKEEKESHKSTENDIDYVYDIAGQIDNISENIEIKSLTQLIKDTLDDIKK
jgi:chromosome segregation ATPase